MNSLYVLVVVVLLLVFSTMKQQQQQHYGVEGFSVAGRWIEIKMQCPKVKADKLEGYITLKNPVHFLGEFTPRTISSLILKDFDPIFIRVLKDASGIM